MRKGAILWLILSLVLMACRASTADTTLPVIEPSGPASTSTSTSSTSPSTTQPVDPRLAEVEQEIAAMERELALLEAEQGRLEQLLSIGGSYPIQVEDDRGEVTIEAMPERVVSLSATHTEMLFAVGAGSQVVATDLTSNFPVAATETEKVDSFNFSIEEIAALEPDLVILAFDFQGETEALATLGIPFLLLGPPDSLDAALFQVVLVGAATGHYGAAVTIFEEMATMAKLILKSAAPLHGVTIYHEVDETLYSATSASFIGDIYSRLGLVNIADTAEAGGQFPQLSAEFIVDQDPEFIFLADANFGVTPETVAARPGWDTIRAVADGNVIPLDGDMAGRWGPRTVDLMQSILDAVLAAVP